MGYFQNIKNKSKGDFANKTISSFVLKIVGLALSYSFLLIVTRCFGADSYGKFSIAFAVLNVFALVFAMGIPDAIIKIASDQTIYSKYHFRKTSLSIILVSSVVGALTLFVLSKLFSVFYKDDSLYLYFLIAAITLVPLIILRLNFETLRANKEIIRFGLLSHIIPFLAASSIVLIAFYSFNTLEDNIVIKAYAIGVLIALLISLYWTKNKTSTTHLKKYSAKQLMQYSLPMLATSSFIFVMGWTDTLMLGYYMDKADVGIYNVVIRIARIAIIAITSVNLVLAPKISELYGNSEIDKMKHLIIKSTRLIFLATAPVVLVIVVANKYVLSIFGDEFIAGGTALIIIMIAQFFNAMTGSVGQVMNMTGHHKKLRNLTLFSAILNVTLNLILIPFYGILGAAIATASSSIMLNLISVIFVKNTLGITTYYLPFNSKKN